MKKQLQLILVVGLLLPSSTGVLLASSANCREWVAQSATQAVETVVARKRHYSKKVLAAWARWRARHPHARLPKARPVLRPGSLSRAQVPDVLGFYCDATVSTVDDVIAALLSPAASETAPPAPDEAAAADDSPGLYTLAADAAPPPGPSTPVYGAPPLSGGPGGFSAPPSPKPPFQVAPPPGFPPGNPPAGYPPAGDPPTTGTSVPPPPVGPPVAVAPEPDSLLLLGTGIAALAGAFRRRLFR